jgi:ATP-dependent DNA helicase UvrD/PcrA
VYGQDRRDVSAVATDRGADPAQFEPTSVRSAPRTLSPGEARQADLPSALPDQANLFGSTEDDPFGPSDQATLDAIDSDDAEEPAVTEVPARPVSRMSVREIVEMVIQQSGLEEYLRKIGGEEHDELDNVKELITSATEFDKEKPEGSLDDFLAQISLVSDADHMQGAGGAITLMTLHAAKGLEFPVVAIIGLEEGVLPHSRARQNSDDLEEERRLFFVGITRAQERLIISKAAQRTIRGIRERTIPSPFLYEMPSEDLNTIDRTGVESFAPQRRPSSWPQSAARGRDSSTEDTPESSYHRPATGQYSHLRAGQTVRHPRYGIGKIREIDETSEQRTRAVVQFNQVGQKTFYLEYNVQLEVID